MTENQQLLQRFYIAFASRDSDGMAACYAPDVTFSDPVFPDLRGPQVMAMWRMLAAVAGDRTITFGDIQADEHSGSVSWEARYEFSATGRPVHNKIRARFTIADGKIVSHVDTFDFWRWARMALGAPGLLFGWTPWLQHKVQAQIAAKLEQFMSKQSVS